MYVREPKLQALPPKVSLTIQREFILHSSMPNGSLSFHPIYMSHFVKLLLFIFLCSQRFIQSHIVNLLPVIVEINEMK